MLDKKREQSFWIEMLIVSLAEELSFRGTRFSSPLQLYLSPNLLGNGAITALTTSC